MNNDVNLTIQEAEKLKNKKIGEGSEAVVYRASKKIVYKIYHTTNNILVPDDAETKIVTSLKDIKTNDIKLPPLDYYDINGVRISREDAVNRAIEKQKYIKMSSLPLGNVMINNRFRGCVYKAYNHCIPIHSIKTFPKTVRLKIIKELLLKVDELLKQTIYPIDLANKPTVNQTHSNVLVSLNLHPHLIDLDGQSTVYREQEDEFYYQLTMRNLKILILELLEDFDYNDDEAKEDIEYFEYIIEDDMSKLLFKELHRDDTKLETLQKILQK